MIVKVYAESSDKNPMGLTWDLGKGVPKEMLADMYLRQHMTSGEIGRIFGASTSTVCNKLKSLGVKIRPMAADLQGQRFGRWTIVKEVGRSKDGCALWECHCDCGTIRDRTTNALKSGLSKSCGCLTKEKARQRHGPLHPSYTNGRTNKEGYVMLSDKRGHPNASKRGRILEHTLVMSEFIGRPIRPEEEVHHKNGIRNDNRIENLELRVGHHGAGARVSDMIEFCVDYLNKYAPQKLAKEAICIAS
jgi:hypothetical protein